MKSTVNLMNKFQPINISLVIETPIEARQAVECLKRWYEHAPKSSGAQNALLQIIQRLEYELKDIDNV